MPVSSVAIGVDIGGTGTKGGLVDLTGNVLVREEHPTDPQAATKTTIEVVERLIERARELDVVPVAAGIGAAGFIDFAQGRVNFSPNVVYDDPEVADAVSSRTDLAVVVDNDANAAVWGERAFGSAQGLKDVALLILGTGLGAGFIVDGHLLRGRTGAGAEFGHTVVDMGGPACGCGLRGCIEQYASGQAIARLGREAAAEDPTTSILTFAGSVESITAYDVARAARELDETARAVLRTAGRALGVAMSNVANLFDPEAIVLAGNVIGAGEPLLGPARDALAEMTEAQRRRPLRVLVSKLGPDAGIIGAAALALEELDAGGSRSVRDA